MLKVILETDPFRENPNDEGEWHLYSFNSRHIDFKQPAAQVQDRPRHAFLLSYYEHSLCRWSLHHEGPSCQWYSVDTAGILLWKGKPQDLSKYWKTFEERQKFARQFCNHYTAFCNGTIYGWRVEDEEGELIDGGNGYYDTDNYNATEELIKDVNAVLKNYSNKCVEVEGDGEWMLSYEKLILPVRNMAG